MGSEQDNALKKLVKSDHRFKVVLYSTLLVSVVLLIIALLVSSMLMLRLQDIGERIEDTQRGNTCILLIKPDKRTVTNVTECVEKNRTKPKNSNFQFNTAPVEPIFNSAPAISEPVPNETPEETNKEVDKEVAKLPEIIFSTLEGRNVWKYVGDSVWSLCDNRVCDI